MANIKCPHCGQEFDITGSDLDSIINQIRTHEFEEQVRTRVEENTKLLNEKKELEIREAVSRANAEADKRLQEEKDSSAKALADAKEKVSEAEKKAESAKADLVVAQMQAANVKKEAELDKMQAVAEITSQRDALKAEYEATIKAKDEQIGYYKDLKARMSTKMVGETLEQHCETEFEKLRPVFPKSIEFHKDNEVSKTTGSKGDFIYREWDEDGNEVISIMFEMKNEMETTATKHKNEDFLKELDKDRKEKGCEYAVLVSMLEADSELYNQGIVDVSYRFEKMYVVRPQFFIPIITILRSAALNSMSYKKDLARLKEDQSDLTHFEEDLETFKTSFGSSFKKASERFEDAIADIDKAIANLQNMKENLRKSQGHLAAANNKVEDVSIKRLTKRAPSIADKLLQKSS